MFTFIAFCKYVSRDAIAIFVARIGSGTVRRGNPHTTTQAAAGPKTTLHR